MKRAVEKLMPEKHCNASDFLQIMCDREGIYGFLAQSYLAEPSVEFLHDLYSQLEDIRNNKLFQEGGDLLHEFYGTPEVEFQEKQRDLVKEFAYLFLVPGDHRIHPYESVHRSTKRLLKQKPYDLVVKVFRESGLGKIQECKELEDHISLEFEYMEIMCAEIRAAFEQGSNEQAHELLEKQRLFLIRHILRWVPEFCKKVHKVSKTPFYQGIALLTDAFIASEKVQIGILQDSLDYW
jgi:TorA maturation chaperone TorD